MNSSSPEILSMVNNSVQKAAQRANEQQEWKDSVEERLDKIIELLERLEVAIVVNG